MHVCTHAHIFLLFLLCLYAGKWKELNSGKPLFYVHYIFPY